MRNLLHGVCTQRDVHAFFGRIMEILMLCREKFEIKIWPSKSQIKDNFDAYVCCLLIPDP